MLKADLDSIQEKGMLETVKEVLPADNFVAVPNHPFKTGL